MIRLFINGTAASAGGGLTYLRNVIPELAGKCDVETTALLSPALCREFSEPPKYFFCGGSGVRRGASTLCLRAEFASQVDPEKRRASAHIRG